MYSDVIAKCAVAVSLNDGNNAIVKGKCRRLNIRVSSDVSGEKK
jgi:hypothetical protein